MGSSLAAFAAGKMPNNMPTKPENPRASNAAHRGTLAGGKSGILLAMSIPSP